VTLGSVLNSFEKDMGKQMKSQQLVHAILILFNNVSKIKSKIDGKMQTVLKNVILNQEPSEDIEFINVPNHVKEIFFKIKVSTEKMIFANFAGEVNGAKIVKQLTFNSNKIWELEVAGKEINVQKLGISNTYDLNKKSVENVVTIVDKIHLCKGREIDINSRKIHNHLRQETVGETTIYRHIKCERTVSFNSINKTCRTCYNAKCPSLHETDNEQSKKAKLTNNETEDEYININESDNDDLKKNT